MEIIGSDERLSVISVKMGLSLIMDVFCVQLIIVIRVNRTLSHVYL